MRTSDMYEEYKTYILRYEEILTALNELLQDRSVEEFKICKSSRKADIFDFTLEYKTYKVGGSISIKEIFDYVEEKRYSKELVRQAIYELILEQAKREFHARLY